MTTEHTRALLPGHRDTLLAASIVPEMIEQSGAYSRNGGGPPGIVFPWEGPGADGPVLQFRPDDPGPGQDGKIIKYVSPKGSQLPFNRVRDPGDGGPVLIVEGTKQQYAVASYAPPAYAVYGISGCWTWSGLPVHWTENRDVFLIFDGDALSNRHVYDGMTGLRDQLERNGAASVRMVITSALGKRGVDDELALLPADARARFLDRWITQALTSWPKAPAATSASPYFEKGSLLAMKAAKAIMRDHPSALTAERKIAMYRGGVYHLDGSAFVAAVVELLEDQHRPSSRAAIEEVTAGLLYASGTLLPDRCASPLLNLADGMLDLCTGELSEHSPDHLSGVQLPVEWNGGTARCPVYEAWLASVCPDQADDLEEVCATMLDPSRTPTKALFAFGPARSGKSTILRLLAAVAGGSNYSAVSLHQLVQDRFAAANVYGKILNTSADLSSAHVEDLSIFKMMTGEDPIHANRKYGSQFSFFNQALFAFSANELPTVGESSTAYTERIKPFEFPHSFAGREDPEIERQMMKELPGILARWVAAWRRKNERGSYAETLPRVFREFETRSDRVRQWLGERAELSPARAESALPAGRVTSKVDLYKSFMEWAEEQHSRPMGRQRFIGRLTSIDGVVEVRTEGTRARALNVRIKKDWEEDQTITGQSGQSKSGPGNTRNHLHGISPSMSHMSGEEAQNEYVARTGPTLPTLPALPDLPIADSTGVPDHNGTHRDPLNDITDSDDDDAFDWDA